MTTSVASPPPSPDDGESYYDKFMLRDAASVRAHLQQLIDKRCTLSATGDGGAVSLITAPLALSDDTLWVDVPPAEETLQRLLACSRLSFEGVLDRITLRFSCGPAVLGHQDHRPALAMPMPTRLLHMQRREFMRREPMESNLHCQLRARDATAATPPVAATIRDIGGGGLAMLATDDNLVMNPGDLLQGCVIELPQLGPVEVTLRIRHVVLVQQRGKQVRQAGCEFVDLRPAAQTKLFRYIMQLDREYLARKRECAAD